MTNDLDDISRQIDLALDKLFRTTDLLESMNYVGYLSKLLRPSDPRATQDPKSYTFIKKTWARVISEIREAEAHRTINSFDDLPQDLRTHVTEVIGMWQSLLRYHPRGDMVYRACVDIINESGLATLERFAMFLDRVNTRGEEFIDPRVMRMVRGRLTGH